MTIPIASELVSWSHRYTKAFYGKPYKNCVVNKCTPKQNSITIYHLLEGRLPPLSKPVQFVTVNKLNANSDCGAKMKMTET
jgi:hypothetical protein